MAAMPQLMAEWTEDINNFSGPDELADTAYDYADAMLRARARR